MNGYVLEKARELREGVAPDDVACAAEAAGEGAAFGVVEETIGDADMVSSAVPGASSDHRIVARSWSCPGWIVGWRVFIIGLVVEVTDPFPDIASHIVQAVAIGGVAARLCCIGVVAGGIVIEFGAVCCARFTYRGFIPPGVVLAFQAAAGGFLPLGFGGQAPPPPFTVSLGFLPIGIQHRVIGVLRVVVIGDVRVGRSRIRRCYGVADACIHANGVLAVGDLVLVYVKGIQRDGVNRLLVGTAACAAHLEWAFRHQRHRDAAIIYK